MKDFIEELKHNRNVNIEKDLENRVDIDYVIERLEDIRKNSHNMTYAQKIGKIVEDTDNLIIDTLGTYDTSDLEDIVLGLITNHTFSSKDSIQNLIYSLEKVMEVI